MDKQEKPEITQQLSEIILDMMLAATAQNIKKIATLIDTKGKTNPA